MSKEVARSSEQPQPEIVQLGQDFQLFNPKTLRQFPSGSLETSIILSTGLLPNFQIIISATDLIDRVNLTQDYYCPFDPERGYVITGEDFKLKTRIEKRKKITGQTINPERASLALELSSDADQLEDVNLCTTEYHNDIPSWKFNEDTTDILSRLEVSLFFPNMQCASIPEINDSPIPLLWWNFYPLDFSENVRPFARGILLPYDFDKLAQIRGKFELREPRMTSEEELQ